MPTETQIGRTMTITLEQRGLLEAEAATAEFRRTIQSMRAMGMTDVQIRQRLLSDFVDENGMLFRSFANRMKNMVADAVHQAYEVGVVSAYDAELEQDHAMRWTTVGDENVCEDCDLRAGEARPLSEWKILGLPKSGFSRCGNRCRCEITPDELDAPSEIRPEKTA